MTPSAATPAERGKPRYRVTAACDAMRRPDVLAAQEARIQWHAERVAREIGVMVREPEDPGFCLHRGRPSKPVISDRGEWFASTTLAGKRFHKTRAGILHSIVRGGLCSKRHWHYATESETAAAAAKNQQKERAA